MLRDMHKDSLVPLKKMKFKSIKDAKQHTLRATSRYFGEEEARRKIDDYKDLIAHDAAHSDMWKEEIASLEGWLESSIFKNGEHPQGIDDLVINLVEWRALIYAFDNVQLVENPFRKYRFHAQWIVGAQYAIFCIMGKLVSTDGRDNSIKNIWKDVCDFLIEEGCCSKEEVNLFTQNFSGEGHFKKNSKTLLFRNKAVAHNEASPRIQWQELDDDIALLIRAWTLLVIFCSMGILSPFVSDQEAFSGFENVVTTEELLKLKGKRREYLQKVYLWSGTNIAIANAVPGRTAFSQLSFGFM